MFRELWEKLLYLIMLFWQCKYDDRMDAGSLNKTQYSGKWHFLMVAADSNNSLIKFRAMDSSVFMLTPMDDTEMLLLRGEIRLSQCVLHCLYGLRLTTLVPLNMAKQPAQAGWTKCPFLLYCTYKQKYNEEIASMKCMTRQWTYHINNETQELILEGQPDLKTEIFVKKNNDCILLLETQEKGSETFRRLMLYDRSPTVTKYSRLEFEHRANCMNLSSIFVLEQAQVPCEL
ncbi:apolipoprotein M-like [Carcharodon carcharias]|uniref:apolipoprotein M-like n=1 Tax=Carcharodon carcharias TaxID=13397 RepID=UPI001B7F1A6A|nr:apolipoprotein M-like [Carcharodon carcharias]